MPLTSARSQARLARRRRIRCAWCNRPFTTYHRAVKYCPGRLCKLRAKAERYRLTLLVRRARAQGLDTPQSEFAELEAPARGRRRTP